MSAYKITDPFVISFSGGRTSAFMLWNILQQFGGKMPDHGHCVFANTGREHAATLEFVRDIGANWGVNVVWIERDFSVKKTARIVSYETCSRNGEPFTALIRKKHYLPNPVTRFCTEDLKVRPIAYYMHSIGVTEGTMVVGLRADEPRRVHRVQGDTRNGFDYLCPMYKEGHTIEDVNAFWKTQPFDLRLPNDDRAFGNCDLCMLKGKGMLERVMKHQPELAQWWIDREKEIGAKFRKDLPTYEQMLVQIRIQPELFGGNNDDDTAIPCTCTE